MLGVTICAHEMDVYYTDSNDNIRFVSDIKTPNQNIGIVGKVAKALVKELTGKPAEIVETKIETGGKEDIYSITNNLTGNSTDSTAIDVREKPLKKEKKKTPKIKKKRGRKRRDDSTPAELKAPSLCNQQLTMDSTEKMLDPISTSTDIGRKINAKGNGYAWIGGKLHLGVVDGDIPITAIYTCASVHDSQVAIPVINETTKRVDYLYDLCDKAYDSEPIAAFSKIRGHIPIIDVNPRNCEATKTVLEGQKNLEKMGFNTPMSNHYNHRSSVERVNSYLKDSFGCKHITVKGATKVASHLMFGVLALCIHQSIKLLT